MLWLTLAPLLASMPAASHPEERRFMVTNFDRLRVDGPYEVEILPGSPGAVAEGSPKALERVTIRVEGSILIIGTETSGWELGANEAQAPTKITVRVPSLRMITTNRGATVKVAQMRGERIDLGLNGTGAIDVAGLDAGDLNISLTGSGEITLAGTATRIRLRSIGTGSVSAEELTADDAMLATESTGEARMRVRYTAQVRAMGSGGVTILGNPKCRKSGTGPIICGVADAP